MTAPLTAAELAAILAGAEAATPGPWYADRHWLTRLSHKPLHMMSDEDADFIAACRSDVPRLVAELTRAREALRLVAARKRDGLTLTVTQIREIARAALGEEPADGKVS